MNQSLTFFRSLGVKIAKDRLTLTATALRAFVFAFLPLFYRKRHRVLLVAFPALKLIVWHGNTSFKNYAFDSVSEKDTRSKSSGHVARKLALYAGFQ